MDMNLIGRRFGRLVVESRGDKYTTFPSEGYRWNCKCDCGNSHSVIQRSLTRGRTNSCGCLARGDKGGLIKRHPRTVASWNQMLRRCKTPTHPEYPNYGGRGIMVCERWTAFANFLFDMGERPVGRTIDRIDNDLGYFKENCRWATPREQTLNRRATRFVEANGERLCISDWAARLGIHQTTMHKAAAKAGRPVEEICQERITKAFT